MEDNYTIFSNTLIILVAVQGYLCTDTKLLTIDMSFVC